MQLIETLASCLPLIILITGTLVLVWKVRGRIEYLKFSVQGFEIRFNKSGKQR